MPDFIFKYLFLKYYLNADESMIQNFEKVRHEKSLLKLITYGNLDVHLKLSSNRPLSILFLAQNLKKKLQILHL